MLLFENITETCSGPTSFEDLRIVNYIILQTYLGACKILGLLEGDYNWGNTLGKEVAGIASNIYIKLNFN